MKPRGRDDAGGVGLRRMRSQGSLQPLSSVPAIAEVAHRDIDISFASRRKIRLDLTQVCVLVKVPSSLINATAKPRVSVCQIVLGTTTIIDLMT